MSPKRKAVFLDRDGTINEEVDFLHRAEEMALIPGAAQAIRRLREGGFLIVVVTNQSGVGRGYYSEGDVETLHRHMAEELAREGASVDAWYFCPHHPEKAVGSYRVECDCRKPLPGMLQAGEKNLEIDLSASYMVGDKLADVGAALAAGCFPVLVSTGYGAKVADKRPAGVSFVADLAAAADLILEREAEIDG